MQATRTYLELKEPTQFKDAFGTFPDITVARVPQPSPDLYRTCYRTVGEAFHWFDPAAAIPELVRVLRPRGGLAIVSTHWWETEPPLPVDALEALSEPYERSLPRRRPP